MLDRSSQNITIPDPASTKKEICPGHRYRIDGIDDCGSRAGDNAKIVDTAEPWAIDVKYGDEDRHIINGDGRSGYPGGKGGAGVYQTIINLIPPHGTYIETHLGGGAIMRHKKPAAKNIGIDIDPGVTAAHGDTSGITIINGDAGRFLQDYVFIGTEFVYCDPPYLMETRKSGPLYNFEYSTDDHVNLLRILIKLPCMVMISGYWSELYDELLLGWDKRSFETVTRGGSMATEWVWFNYPNPIKLHDYSFLGSTFRERERIKRKRQRWIKNFANIPILERRALFNELRRHV